MMCNHSKRKDLPVRLLFALFLLVGFSLMAGPAYADVCDGSNPGAPCNEGGTEGTCDEFAQCIPNPNEASGCGEVGQTCFIPGEGTGVCNASLQCVMPGGEDVETPEPTCTDDERFNPKIPEPGKGIVSSIVTRIRDLLTSIAQQMFNQIVANTGFIEAVTAIATLFIAIYGIAFTFGIVQLTVFDFAIRCIKIGVLVLLLSPQAWTYFNDVVVKLFNDGTDHIINKVSEIAVVNSSLGANIQMGTEPFVVLDQILANLVSTRMFINMMTALVTGPYGFMICAILIMSIFSFLKALLNAMWVYIMALVMRTLLFGLAPIFIPCIMFTRTRHLFDGWLNQLVNSALQPIFLFTFFTFFCLLIRACIDQILNLQICWTEWSVTIRGTPMSAHYWRYKIEDPNLGILVPFDGQWGWSGPIGVEGSQPVHPLGVLLPLTMWILADLASRFNHIVIDIAKDISNAATDLRMGGEKATEWFSGSRGHGGHGGPGPGGRGKPMGGRAGGARPGPGGRAPAGESGRPGGAGAGGRAGGPNQFAPGAGGRPPVGGSK